MAELKHTVKDSVFSFIFRDPGNRRKLYLALHPEDTDITEEECKLVTLENMLVSGLTNDLGVLVRNTLIILMEAQSTFTRNITLRILLYLAKTYKEYVQENQYNLYSTKPVSIPRPELYMVYVGEPREIPDVLHLSDLYSSEGGDVELTVHVLKDSGQKNIVDQYIRFSEICNEERKVCRSEEAPGEILRRCKEEGVLMPFLQLREKEVSDIMVTLFDEEYVAKMFEREIREESLQEGMQKGLQKGMQQGIQQGREKAWTDALRNLVTATGWPLEKAMTSLNIPEVDRMTYREILQGQ